LRRKATKPTNSWGEPNMQMTAKEQALLTIVLDDKLLNMQESRYATSEVWGELYDAVIDAEIEDDYGDDFCDFVDDFLSGCDCPDEQEQFNDDVAVVDAHMTALQGEDLADDEKQVIAASFVQLMDNDTAEMIFQAIADRWSEEAKQRFNDFNNERATA
jgi:hypothetical protein